MKRIIFVLIIFFMFLISANVYGKLEVWDVKCENNGKLTLILWARDENRTYTDKIQIRAKSFNLVNYEKEDFIVEGSWDKDYLRLDPPTRYHERATFTSKEAQLNKQINYNIEMTYDDQKLETSVDCPGLIFSCSLINVSIENCTTKEGHFESYLEIKGLNQSLSKSLNVYEDLKYNIRSTEKYFDIRGEYSKEGSLPKDAVIRNIDQDKYLLSYDFPKENFVESIIVEFKDPGECRKYDISLRDYKQCNIIYVAEPLVIKEYKKEIEEKLNESIEEVEEFKEPETKNINRRLVLIVSIAFVVAIIILILFFKFKKKEIKDEWFKDIEKRL